MVSAPRFLVFSDLDGTLIDHRSYEWEPARPALQAIKDAGGAVILASSKTAVEITTLRTAMALEAWPAIVENGAGLLPAQAEPTEAGDDYAKLRAILDAIPPELREHYTGFGDLDAQGVADITGLGLDDAKAAKTRTYSEPGTWTGSAATRAEFEARLRQHGVWAREGGRFLTLSFGHTKSDQMAAILQQYQVETTIALGDAPNDVEMLEAADHGVIIANPNRAPLPPCDGEAQGRIIRTTKAGPEGWNDAILDLLKKLDLEGT